MNTILKAPVLLMGINGMFYVDRQYEF